MSDISLHIPYQRSHKRWSVLLRPILMIPIITVMFLMIVPNQYINAGTLSFITDDTQEMSVDRKVSQEKVPVFMMDAEYNDMIAQSEHKALLSGGLLLLAYLLIIPVLSFSLWHLYVVNFCVGLTLLFRKKYPDWWFNWNQNLQSFVLRMYCYALFITDKYPSLEEAESDIKLRLPNPKEENLNRFMPIIKWILVIPYLIIYHVFLMGALLLVPVSFLLILVTGKLPHAIYWYQMSVIKFYLRIVAYAVLLTTDRFPKFIFRD
ncbi:DUF4389 domain-containing protein [Gammaproteobacteria bacterium]|nr:DUF4389 domain-containing protein [Gammaproteobacteria bacterium]